MHKRVVSNIFRKLGETYKQPLHSEHIERMPDSFPVSACSEIFSPLISMTPQENVLVEQDQEMEQMLKEGAIKVVQQDRSLFLSSIFAVPKMESGHCPVINLKILPF